MTVADYEKIIEAVLFASGEAVSLGLLSQALELDTKTTRNLLHNLMGKCVDEERGLLIKEIDGSYQLCTNSRYFDYILRMAKVPQKKTLTQSVIETLAIIAYKQPITKAKIEEIRGVNADHGVNKLLEYDLICETGRLDAPGKPILFGTSAEFLRHFGLSSIHELPELETNFEELKKEVEAEAEKYII